MQNFTDKELMILQQAEDFQSLAEVALSQLSVLRSSFAIPPGIVCGPISNGGLGTKAANITHFERVVNHFVKVRRGNFFSQIPFEEALWRVQAHLAEQEPGVVHPKGAGNPLLEKFYKPLFESEMLGAAFFIKGWESSDGAVWEHNLCERLGLGIWHLDHNLTPTLIQRNQRYM